MFGIVNEILVVGYDRNGVEHDKTLCRALQICRKKNIKLNTDKCHFRCTSVPFLGEIISRKDIRPNPRKLKALTDMTLLKLKRDCKHLLEYYTI